MDKIKEDVVRQYYGTGGDKTKQHSRTLSGYSHAYKNSEDFVSSL